MIGVRIGQRLSRDVTRRQGHWETQAKNPVLVPDVLQVFDLDGDHLARTDVGNRGRKQVGALLFHQACLFAGRPGVFVFSACLLFLPDLTLDKTFADTDAHVIDRGFVRQRKYVDTLDPLATLVPKHLPDDRTRHQAADGKVDLGIQ